MYKHDLKTHGEYLADAVTVPQNDTVEADPLRLSGELGGVEIKAVVNADIAIADTKSLTPALKHSDVMDSAFIALATIYTATASGGSLALAKGTELARFILPTTAKPWVKASIATTDAAATGKVDIYPTYLAR